MACDENIISPLPKLFTTKELAKHLGLSINTIRKYRLEGSGPVYIKLGHIVRYKISDVEKWLDGQKV